MPAKSKSQQRLFGMVHAYQTGRMKDAPAFVKRIAKHISKSDARHFAKTRHEGLPETKKAETRQMIGRRSYSTANRGTNPGTTKKNIGKILLGMGFGIPLAFLGRGKIMSIRAARATRRDALKSIGEVDDAVRQILSRSGKTLPRHEWRTIDDIRRTGKLGIGPFRSDKDILLERSHAAKLNQKGGLFRFDENIPLQSQKTVPVYSNGYDVLKGLKMMDRQPKKSLLEKVQSRFERFMRRGAHFSPSDGYVSLGTERMLSPKVLLHELGHAQDAIDGRLIAADRTVSPKSLKEWWRYLRDPDSTPLLQTEIRAWNNGGIASGDPVRERALDTYRNAVQAKMMAYATPMAAWPGAYMYNKGRKEEMNA